MPTRDDDWGGVLLCEAHSRARQATPRVESPYLTVPEAAAYLRTTVQGVYSLVKRGKLHPCPGSVGRLLFTVEALDRCRTIRRRDR
jgi:excisionase family DNA binding protein